MSPRLPSLPTILLLSSLVVASGAASRARAQTPPPAKAPAAAAAPATTPAPTAAPAAAVVAPRPALPAAPAGPAPEVDKLKFLAGTFACDATAPARGNAPEQRWKGRFLGKLDLGGHFVTFQYSDTKDKAHPVARLSTGFVGWDVGQHKYVIASADSSGTSFLLRAEAPAAIDQWEFKGSVTTSYQRYLPALHTLTRTLKGFDLAFDGTDDDKVARLLTLSCTRAGK